MKKLTAPGMDRCIGCHSCSLACARLVHGLHSWSAAGIRIRSSGGLTTGFEADICMACNPAPCAKACPTQALTQRKGGGIKMDRTLCIRCGVCAKVCPVGAVYIDKGTAMPYICLHCGLCTSFCPHNCLALAEIPETEASENITPNINPDIDTSGGLNAKP